LISATAPRRKGEVANVQALRAGAALLVAIGHGAHTGTVPLWFGTFLSWFSYAGVDVFFVISGFIVSQAAARAGDRVDQEGRVKAAFDFAVRRIFRIFPPYWLALAVAIWFGPWLDIAPAGWPQSPPLLPMVTLNTMWITPLPAAWTLAFEVYFYAVLNIVILIAGRRVSVGILIGMILQIALIAAPRSGWLNWEIGSNELVFEFAFGWVVGEMIKRTNGALGWLSSIVAVPFLGTGMWLTAHQGLLTPAPRVMTFGIGSALLLYAVLRLEISGRKAPTWLQRIGDVSYSIYLWHLIVFGAVYAVLSASPSVFMLALAVLIVWGLACHAVIEVPAQELGRIIARLASLRASPAANDEVPPPTTRR